MLLGHVRVAPGAVELRPRRSQEVRGSPELQNGGLRALDEAWMTTSRLRHFLSSLSVAAQGWRLRLEAESWRVRAGGWRLGWVWRVEAGERDPNALRVFLAVTWLTVYRQSQVPQPGSRHLGLVQSSQATVLELWASPDLLSLFEPSSPPPLASGRSKYRPNLPNYISQIGCDMQF